MLNQKESINKFNTNTSEEEILQALEWRCSTNNNTPTNFRELEALYLTQLLSNINQKKLLTSQNEFNQRIIQDNAQLIKQNKSLVRATWTAVIVSIVGLVVGSIVTQKIYIDRLKTSQLEIEQGGYGIRFVPGPTSTIESYSY